MEVRVEFLQRMEKVCIPEFVNGVGWANRKTHAPKDEGD